MPSLFNLYHFPRPREAPSGALGRPWEFWAARLPQAIRAGAAALGSLRRRSAHAAPGARAEPARPRPPGRQLMGRPPGRPPPPREHGGRDPLQAAEQPSGAAEQDRGASGRRHGRAAHPQGGRRHHRQRGQVGPAGGAPAETRSGRPVLPQATGCGGSRIGGLPLRVGASSTPGIAPCPSSPGSSPFSSRPWSHRAPPDRPAVLLRPSSSGPQSRCAPSVGNPHRAPQPGIPPTTL